MKEYEKIVKNTYELLNVSLWSEDRHYAHKFAIFRCTNENVLLKNVPKTD